MINKFDELAKGLAQSAVIILLAAIVAGFRFAWELLKQAWDEPTRAPHILVIFRTELSNQLCFFSRDDEDHDADQGEARHGEHKPVCSKNTHRDESHCGHQIERMAHPMKGPVGDKLVLLIRQRGF